jgi:predicted dehydrogenase/nucleoside-diphosphate-sugar epimerase
MDTTGSIRVGLVGAGPITALHVQALRSLPFVEIIGLADIDDYRVHRLAEEFAIPNCYSSLEALLEASPNVVHILTPPDSHAPLAIQAMKTGCHVFVEGALAETVDDCDRMIACAHRNGVTLSVNHSARFDPVVLQALEMVRAGACGEILAADLIRSSAYTPYSGGPNVPPQFGRGSYPLQDVGLHGLYLLEAFLGSIEHADIRYYASGMGDPNLVFDEWRGLLECRRGTGHMYLSWNVRPMQNEIVVHGTRGVMHVDCELQTISLRKISTNPIQSIFAAGLNSLNMLWSRMANTARPSPGIRLSVAKFYEALRNGTPPPVPAEEGRHILSLIEDVSRRADADKFEYLAETNPDPAPRILVTGASGFLGSALVRRLRQSGEPIRLLVRRPTGQPPEEGVHFVYGDLGNPAVVDRAMRGIDVVYHAGAAMKGGPFEFQSGTIWGTRNVIDACIRHRVRRLVHVSSMSVLDHAGHPAEMPVNESAPYEPHPEQRDLFTQTKLEAEKAVLQAVREGLIDAVVLRPGQIYGPGAEHVPPSGTIPVGVRWVVVGSGDRYVPFVYVDNVVDAMLLAAGPNVPAGAIFQLVDPTGIDQRAYIERLQRTEPVRSVSLPLGLVNLAAIAMELWGKLTKSAVPLTRYRVRSFKPLWPCDCAAAYTKLGWNPRVGLAEGLDKTFGARAGASQPSGGESDRP